MSFMPLDGAQFQPKFLVGRMGAARGGGQTAAAVGAEALFDVVLDDLHGTRGDAPSPRRVRAFAVDEHGRGRRLAGAGQADADVGMFARPGR